MVKDILKSVAWGLMLLIVLIVGGISIVGIYIHTSERISSTELHANQRFKDSVSKELGYLSRYIDESSRISSWRGYNDPLVKEANADIQKAKDNCNECTPIYVNSLNDASDIRDFNYELGRNANPESVRDFNQIHAVGAVFSLLTLLMSIYLFAALMRYKSLSSIGLMFVMLLFVPIYIATMDMATFHPDYKYWGEKLAGDGMPIMLSIFAMFVVYPPVFILAKKHGVSIKSAITLRGVK